MGWPWSGGSLVRQVDNDLQNIKDLVLEMGGNVEKAIEEACNILLHRNLNSVSKVETHEARINDLHIEVDHTCLELLAKQAPVARDLRFVMAAIKINADLERMGDQASNIAFNGADVTKRGGAPLGLADFEAMARATREMVKMALDAFVRRDVQLSEMVLDRDDAVDELKDKLFVQLKQKMSEDPAQIDVCLDLILIARNLERVADHATNIAEEVIFITTGDDVRHGHRHSVGQ